MGHPRPRHFRNSCLFSTHQCIQFSSWCALRCTARGQVCPAPTTTERKSWARCKRRWAQRWQQETGQGARECLPHSPILHSFHQNAHQACLQFALVTVKFAVGPLLSAEHRASGATAPHPSAVNALDALRLIGQICSERAGRAGWTGDARGLERSRHAVAAAATSAGASLPPLPAGHLPLRRRMPLFPPGTRGAAWRAALPAPSAGEHTGGWMFPVPAQLLATPLPPPRRLSQKADSSLWVQANTRDREPGGDGGSWRLRIMSYNVLADHLAHEHAAELYNSGVAEGGPGAAVRAEHLAAGRLSRCAGGLCARGELCVQSGRSVFWSGTGPRGGVSSPPTSCLPPCLRRRRTYLWSCSPTLMWRTPPAALPAAPRHAIEWGFRSRLIVQEIARFLPDVVCLQVGALPPGCACTALARCSASWGCMQPGMPRLARRFQWGRDAACWVSSWRGTRQPAEVPACLGPACAGSGPLWAV